MKRIVSAFFALIFLFAFVTSAFSANIDGIDSGFEWENATAYKLTDGESNCGVDFGLVKVKFDTQNNAVFLCFMFIDPALEPENLSTGISVSIENSEPFIMTMASSPQNIDIDKYHIEGAMSVDENNGATCELRVGIKAGLPKNLSGSVRFIDANGEPSNYYDFILVNEEYVETTELIISPTKDNDDPVYNPNLLTQKATKEQTVKPKTTQKKKTTTKQTERTRWTISDSPYSYTGRTKRQEKKTEPLQTIIVPAITVYYYEKEIIISHVYISQPNATVDKTETEPISVSSAATEIISHSDTTSTVVPLSSGSKYKIASILGGGAAFAIIAISGVATVKKKAGVKEDD